MLFLNLLSLVQAELIWYFGVADDYGTYQPEIYVCKKGYFKTE